MDPSSPLKCQHCGAIESERFFVSVISTVCSNCMSNFIETTDVDGDEEDINNDNDFEKCAQSLTTSCSIQENSVSSLPAEGEVYVKNMLQICAMCCKGPAQEGLHKKFTLSMKTQTLHSCAACHSAYFVQRVSNSCSVHFLFSCYFVFCIHIHS